MKKIKIILLISFATLFAEDSTDNRLRQFADNLIGSWSTELHSQKDDYIPHLLLEIREFWQDRNHIWLYYEENIAGSTDDPFRQQVFELFVEDSLLYLQRYTFKIREDYIGEWENEEVLPWLEDSDLIPSDGCKMKFLEVMPGHFRGENCEARCVNRLLGATHSITKMLASPNRLIIHERGFDDLESLKWGPKNGGFIYLPRGK